ncbi:unnamed protein product [Allacma fusca]|uniref:Uncharacterized protein n=1 Tax=Allacma fusca TaxID=39272 RepID=A0A8J2PJM1_9HEXA|nr:unnamed protein product [Allacma fusca]
MTDRPYRIRSRSTFSVTRYPFIPNVSQNLCTSTNNTPKHLPFNHSKTLSGDCLTCKSYLSAEKCSDLSGRGDEETNDINCEYERCTSESDGKSLSETNTKENEDSNGPRDTATAKITSESLTSPGSPYEEQAYVYNENYPTQSAVYFQGKKTKGNLKHVPPGQLSYGEMEAKLQALIIGKFARRKKTEGSLELCSPKNHSAQKEPNSLQTSASGTTLTGTSFRSSDWPFISASPIKKPLKPVLANFDKIEFFQAPFRRLPSAWLQRPETPLQRIYGSVAKQMPFETERDRRKLIDQAITNGQLYRRIKRAKSEYNRNEQLRNFKKHEAFIRFKGPVANLEGVNAKRNKFMSTNCYSYKPTEEVNTDEPDVCDLKSLFDDDSPIITANQ